MDEKLRRQILSMPVAERIRIAGELWDSLGEAGIRLTKAQRTHLRERLAECRATRDKLMTLEEFRGKLQQGKRHFHKSRRKTA